MSNIRDLQRLKGTKPLQSIHQPSHRITPSFNYDPLAFPMPSHRSSKNTHYGK
jgi:hypothetical protein